MSEERNPIPLLGGLPPGAATMKVSMGNTQANDNLHTYYPAITILRIFAKDLIHVKVTHTPIFIAVQTTIAKTLEQPKCLLKQDWLRKLWYIYFMEFTQLFKRIGFYHLHSNGPN